VTAERRSFLARRGWAIAIALVPAVLLYGWTALEDMRAVSHSDVRRAAAWWVMMGYLVGMGLLVQIELPNKERGVRWWWMTLWGFVGMWVLSWVSPIGLQRGVGTVQHRLMLTRGMVYVACADFSRTTSATKNVEWFPGWDGWRWMGGRPTAGLPGWSPVVVVDYSPKMYRYAGVRLWLPIVVAGVAFGLTVARARRRWVEARKVAAGLCPRCGYDLRASPERCPECGLRRGRSRLDSSSSVSDN
jgi:hypothetical protein